MTKLEEYKSKISTRLYDQKTVNGEEYKIIEYVGVKGSSHYFKVKFKTDPTKEQEVSLVTLSKNEFKNKYRSKLKTKKRRTKTKKESKKRNEYVTKYIHNPKNILVLDLASESTGYCVCKNCKISEYSYIYHKKTKVDGVTNLIERLNYMKKEIIKLIEENNIDSVVIESLPFKGAKQVLFVLSQIRILVLDYCYENSIQYISVSPQAWEYYSWRGRFKNMDTKERNYMSAKTDCNIDFKKLFVGENELEAKKEVWQDVCDAYLLARYVLNKRIIFEGDDVC